jgi:2'-5' RNA ligase
VTPIRSASAPEAAAPAATARLFVGLWPAARARAGVLRWQAACEWPAGARPTPPERVHLTLHFLGQVERERIAALGRALNLAVPRFELRLHRAAVWLNGVAVLEPAEGRNDVPTALLALHARLGEALQGIGLPLETRPFRPHVTLARRARGAVLPVSRPKRCVGRCTVTCWSNPTAATGCCDASDGRQRDGRGRRNAACPPAAL